MHLFRSVQVQWMSPDYSSRVGAILGPLWANKNAKKDEKKRWKKRCNKDAIKDTIKDAIKDAKNDFEKRW